jgi:predicted nuclease of predicted toxin-antitoxin system
MKLLIDSCVAGAVTRRLREQGHDVVSVAERGGDPGDRAILEFAHAEGRAIVTIDVDFGTLIFRDQVQRVGVLRMREAPASVLVGRASVLIAAHEDDLTNGAFITDDGDRVRVTR